MRPDSVPHRRRARYAERLLVASAASYVVSPSAMGPVATDPRRTTDPLSASYLIALAARVVREVSDLVRRSREADKRLPTLSVERFPSTADASTTS